MRLIRDWLAAISSGLRRSAGVIELIMASKFLKFRSASASCFSEICGVVRGREGSKEGPASGT